MAEKPHVAMRSWCGWSSPPEPSDSVRLTSFDESGDGLGANLHHTTATSFRRRRSIHVQDHAVWSVGTLNLSTSLPYTSSSTPSPRTLPSPSIYKHKAKACIRWLVEQRRRGGRQVQGGSDVRADFRSGNRVSGWGVQGSVSVSSS
jgi:hypothetical protein